MKENGMNRYAYRSHLTRKVSKELEARKRLLSQGERLDKQFADRFAAETQRFKAEFAASRDDERRLKALHRALRQAGLPRLKHCRTCVRTVPLPLTGENSNVQELQARTA
jgi:hypothetical protein